MMDLLKDLEWRGLVAQSTNLDDLRTWLESGPQVIYCGFDPSAPSLHMGNLVPLLTLARFQQAGHRPIGLVGGATGLIGDPSGRNSERQLNPTDLVASWVDRLEHQVGKFLSFEDGPTRATLVSNLEWTAEMTALDFLRDIGKHFPVSRMISREAVSARLADQGLSFTEFSYQVLQANDYLELNRRFGCSLQIGGSDQWGNITAGCDLIRRVTGVRAHGLTLPLVTKADGTKFGKTAGGAVWLDPAMTTPYAFYQFWLNTEDRDVIRFLKIFSFRSREEIEDLEECVRSDPKSRRAQHVLASDFTNLVHGPERLSEVIAASESLFGNGDITKVSQHVMKSALQEVPTIQHATLNMPVAKLMVDLGLVSSLAAARRAIGDGGVYINNRPLRDETSVLTADDVLDGGLVILRRGKKSLGGVTIDMPNNHIHGVG